MPPVDPHVLASELERLKEEVAALQELRKRFDGLESRYRAVQEAEVRWSPLLRERDVLVFTNAAADIAKIPRSLALLLAEERPFDGDVDDDGESLCFQAEGVVVARVPKSLARQLRGLVVGASRTVGQGRTSDLGVRPEGPVPVPESHPGIPDPDKAARSSS